MSTELPSRGEAALAADAIANRFGVSDLLTKAIPVLRRFAEGGLVDREAINEEAALEAWQHSTGDDDEAVLAAVAAALGDTDE